MGLLDYYRQFEGLTQQEVNVRLRGRAERRKRHELARVDPIDLSATTWPHLPPPAIVNAVTYAARRGLYRYPDARAHELRSELAHRHAVEAQRIVIGNGASQLLAAAIGSLIEPGQELITPWPSYPLFPLVARETGGHAVPVAGYRVDSLASAVNDRTRVLALASPNDPTGERLTGSELERLLRALPERVVVLLDEALVEFADTEPRDTSLALLADYPRLLVFRSFSKAWGLAGLRCGYAIGGPGSEPLLERLAPPNGVSELAQVGALEALRSCADLVARRADTVAAERRWLAAALRELGFDLTDGQANVLWFGRPGIAGVELARRLERSSVIVAAGAALGEPDRVRAAIVDRPASQRLAWALERALD